MTDAAGPPSPSTGSSTRTSARPADPGRPGRLTDVDPGRRGCDGRVAVAGWAPGSRGGYGQPGTDPVAEAPSPPARQDSGGQGRAGRGGDDRPSGNVEPTGKPAFKPEIQGIWTVPATLRIGQALHLPPGPARVTFRFDIDHATRAQFWLAHGTQVDKTAIWLGEDSYTANGWSVGMRYGDDGFTDNLIIRATGPGGTAEEFVGVTNNGGA